MNKKIKIAIAIVLLLIVGFAIFYISDYYHAEKVAIDSLNNTDDVSAIKTSNGMLLDGPGNDTALIFYPGAKVEYTSYAPLFMNLSSEGIDCYLVEMPFNLAFLGQDSADEIIDDGNYSHYFISGHSLGGAMAASYVNSTNKTDGLILFASYSTSEIEKPVLSIYGSEDKVLDMEKYNESIGFIDDNLTEFEIDGANHAQFGYYGNQSGDGIAKISAESQQKQSVNEIMDFIDGVLA
ncbi:alpha/beta hydrolase [Methanobrevibacter sp.]|uniref:alpha/beta hydrolase n=1 Tax=Methanobrevibacter sp. TaxID=66852 RepID=UPI0038634E7C